jgi:hypothetical protein
VFQGLGFNPLDGAPALLAVIVGLFIWSRHRADRRARVFLALAVVEFGYGIPLSLAAAVLPEGRVGETAVNAMVVGAGLASSALFMHFGFAFPHSRPWLRRGHFRTLYLVAIAAAIFYVAIGLTAGSGDSIQTASMILMGVAVLSAVVLACLAIYRSYREMTADERARYRVPVLGVLGSMVAAFAADVLVGFMFDEAFDLGNRYVLWATNLVTIASELLFPLFFFMAAVKYRLLEHHSPDYVAKL